MSKYLAEIVAGMGGVLIAVAFMHQVVPFF